MSICECCGAKVVKYKFSFNLGLARCLYLMRNYSNGVEIRSLKMTSSMWTNFQKLRYWGLISAAEGENKRKGGYWRLTEKGRDFLLGNIKIPKKAITFRNEVQGFEGEYITFKEVSGGYEYRQDYADQARQQI